MVTGAGTRRDLAQNFDLYARKRNKMSLGFTISLSVMTDFFLKARVFGNILVYSRLL